MQKRWPNYKYFVYSGDTNASKEQILMKAKQRFGIEVDPSNLEFIFLQYRRIVEADLYPRFTLVCQTIAGFFLGVEAFLRLKPEIFIDSMGYPLTLPLFKYIIGSSVAAYVHYPTISCDMIDLVERRESTYNNAETIAKSNVLSTGKLLYYKIFAYCYGLSGKSADIVMVNGSWTQGHITKIWRRTDIRKVFPPCDVSSFLNLEQSAEELFSDDNLVRMLSIGQIRPEKNHPLQLDTLKLVKKKLSEKGYKVQLTIAGGCRGKEDEQRVDTLQKYANKIGVDDNVEWKLNVPYDNLLQLLSESLISIHTMWNEHFGISVVEGMAAGTIMLAHNSGGPQMDIITSNNKKECLGFLAKTAEEFAEVVVKIVEMSAEERERIRSAARFSMKRFSEEEFDKQWEDAIKRLLISEKSKN